LVRNNFLDDGLDNGLLNGNRVGAGDLDGNLNINEALDGDGLRDRDTYLSDNFDRDRDLTGDTDGDIDPLRNRHTDFNRNLLDTLDGVRARDTDGDIDITFNLDGDGDANLNLDRDRDIDRDLYSDGNRDRDLNRGRSDFDDLLNRVRDVHGDLHFSGDSDGDFNRDFNVDVVVDFNVVRCVHRDCDGDGDVNGNLDGDGHGNLLGDRDRTGNGLLDGIRDRAVHVDGDICDDLVVLRNNYGNFSFDRDGAGHLDRDVDSVTTNVDLTLLVDDLGNVSSRNLFDSVWDWDRDVNNLGLNRSSPLLHNRLLDNSLLHNRGGSDGNRSGGGPLLHGGGGDRTNQRSGSGVWNSTTDKTTDGTNITPTTDSTNITPTTDGTNITPTTDGTNITETNSSKACLRQNVCCSDNFGVLGAHSEDAAQNNNSFHHV
jgi:hypothetical protein